jgi:hypothetical protein
VTATVLKLDDRGRLIIATAIRRNGVEPSDHYSLAFGPNQTLILSPVTLTVTPASPNEGVPA